MLESEVEALLSPKTEEDLKPPEKKAKAKAPPKVGVCFFCVGGDRSMVGRMRK